MKAVILYYLFFGSLAVFLTGKPKKQKDGTYTSWNFEAMIKTALLIMAFGILQWFFYFEPRGY